MNFYEVLGVRTDASDRDIRNAYLKLVKEFHPDINCHSKKCDKVTQKINQAYNIIGNAGRKAAYDSHDFNLLPGTQEELNNLAAERLAAKEEAYMLRGGICDIKEPESAEAEEAQATVRCRF